MGIIIALPQELFVRNKLVLAKNLEQFLVPHSTKINVYGIKMNKK